MSARDEICRSLASNRYAPEEWIDNAQAILDALKAAGYAVVELPVGEPDEDGQLWFGNYDLRVDRTGGQVSVWRRGAEISPTMLRLLAGECLAAADAAEATQ